MIEIQLRIRGRALTPACEEEIIETYQQHIARLGVIGVEMRYRDGGRWTYHQMSRREATNWIYSEELKVSEIR
jgi:hypothetical protein